MDINIKKAQTNAEVEILEFSGRLDSYTIEDLKSQLTSLLNIGSVCLVCDFGKVEFITGAALKVFHQATETAQSRGGDVRFCGVEGAVEKALEIAGFDKVCKIYSSQAKAVAAFRLSEAMDDTMILRKSDNSVPTSKEDTMAYMKTMNLDETIDVEALMRKQKEKMGENSGAGATNIDGIGNAQTLVEDTGLDLNELRRKQEKARRESSREDPGNMATFIEGAPEPEEKP
ncbi:MAG: STAS domain-containing protein [Planctomycetes bacterium]|nr:STAS domain-containing protein [Planctomycetota bacterium]